jgi:2'-hydroxyisoflavone reductase
MLETDQMGDFNVASDQGAYTIHDLFTAAIEATSSGATPTYAPSSFLLAQEVAPWMELPLWLPESHINMSLVSAKKALDAGLKLMPLTEVVKSTLDWFNNEPAKEWPAGLASEKEQKLLAALKTWQQ